MGGTIGKQCGMDASCWEVTQGSGRREAWREKGKGKWEEEGLKSEGKGGIRGRGNGRRRDGGIRWKMRGVLKTSFGERESPN